MYLSVCKSADTECIEIKMYYSSSFGVSKSQINNCIELYFEVKVDSINSGSLDWIQKKSILLCSSQESNKILNAILKLAMYRFKTPCTITPQKIKTKKRKDNYSIIKVCKAMSNNNLSLFSILILIICFF